MGEVYLAEHVNLGRKEALKILHPAFARDPQFVARFRREARATNRVSHPNIVSVFDFGQLPDARFFLAMEYAEGEPVDAALHRGPVAIPRALSILAQLADAAHAAHQCGVIHRDLKPANLVLTTHRNHPDHLKVLDFGIAKIIAPDHQDSVASATDVVFGTPAYMAPERFEGAPGDPRSDLYAIGCIAYELLVGEPPFSGNSVALTHAHLNRAAPPLRRRRTDAPPQIEAIIARLLEKDPLKRYPSGRDLSADVVEVLGYRGRSGSGGRRRRVVSMIHAAQTGVDFGEPVDTLERSPAANVALMARSPTEDLSSDAAVSEQRAAVRELAEALVDQGASDISLIVGLAHLNEIADELDRMDTAAEARAARSAAVEQAAREREAALRFALGELRFERSQALGRGEVVTVDLDRQIEQLEGRLARAAGDVTAELDRITDEGIEDAARRDDTEKDLDKTTGLLESLVEEIVPRFAGDDTITRLRGRVANARARRSKA
jgi:serine/threonine protein kinase